MSKNYTNYNKFSKEEKPVEPVVEEKVEETEVENSPEEKIEETPVVEVKNKIPKYAILQTNLFARENPYGNNYMKDDFDRLVGAHVITDTEGRAIVPKDAKVEVYDEFVHEDGSVWYNTMYGYLMAKSKDGKEFIK